MLLVLAGGENKRLGSLSKTIYKGFLPIHNYSIIQRILFRAYLSGINHVVLLFDSEDKLISEFCEDHSFAPKLTIKKMIINGITGIKIVRAYESMKLKLPLMVCVSDTYIKLNFKHFRDYYHSSSYDSLIVISRYKIPYGVCEYNGERVSKFSEKPLTRFFINCGYMIIGEKAMNYLKKSPLLDEAFSSLAAEGDLGGYIIESDPTMVDTLEDLAIAHEVLNKNL